MTAKPSKIRQQMQALEQQLKEAEAAQEKKQIARVQKAAQKSGLAKLELSQQDLERHFSAIVKAEKRSDSGASSAPKPPQSASVPGAPQ